MIRINLIQDRSAGKDESRIKYSDILRNKSTNIKKAISRIENMPHSLERSALIGVYRQQLDRIDNDLMHEEMRDRRAYIYGDID